MKFVSIFCGIIFLVLICVFISTLFQAEIWASMFSFWLSGMTGFTAYDSFRSAQVKGPVFSFSKHGFIDHRSNPASIKDWETVKNVAWTSHSVKGFPYKLLKVEIDKLSISQKLGKLFLHHPYELTSYQIVLESPTEFKKVLRKATPAGKFKT